MEEFVAKNTLRTDDTESESLRGFGRYGRYARNASGERFPSGQFAMKYPRKFDKAGRDIHDDDDGEFAVAAAGESWMERYYGAIYFYADATGIPEEGIYIATAKSREEAIALHLAFRANP